MSYTELNNSDKVNKWQKVQIPYKVSSYESEIFTLSTYTEYRGTEEEDNSFWVIQGIKFQENGKKIKTCFKFFYNK